MPYYPPPGGATLIFRKNSGADVGTRPRVNLIEGSGIGLTVADDAGGDEVDVTVRIGGLPAYTVTGVNADRTIDVDATTLNEALNVFGTFLQDIGVA